MCSGLQPYVREAATLCGAHQHCELVRTGESMSPAMLRLNWRAQPLMKAATCSGRVRVGS